MSKSLNKLAELTAKRAGILADLLGTEREIEQLCRNVAAESVSDTTESLQPKKKRGRKAKEVSAESSDDTGPASESPQISPGIHEKKGRNESETFPGRGLTGKTVVNNLRDSETGEIPAAAPDGVPAAGSAGEAPRKRGRPAKGDGGTPVIEVTPQMNDLLQKLEPGVEYSLDEIHDIGYRAGICGAINQPVARRWLMNTLTAFARNGFILSQVSSEGTAYTRIGG